MIVKQECDTSHTNRCVDKSLLTGVESMTFNIDSLQPTFWSLVLCVSFMLTLPGVSLAQVPAQLAKQPILQPTAIDQTGPHGGSLVTVGNLQIETVVGESGIRLFAFDQAGRQVGIEQGRGMVLLKVASSPKSYRYDLLPDEQGALAANVNLSRTTGKQVEIEVQVDCNSG